MGDCFDKRTEERVMKCLRFAAEFYGVIPPWLLCKLINEEPAVNVMETELIERVENGILSSMPMVIEGENLVTRDVSFEGYSSQLLNAQLGKEYYHPTEEELNALYEERYFGFGKEAEALKHILIKGNEELEYMANDTVELLHRMSADGCDVNNLTETLEDLGFDCNDEVKQYLCELWRNTRMIINRGFTLRELD